MLPTRVHKLDIADRTKLFLIEKNAALDLEFSLEPEYSVQTAHK